MVMVKVWPVRQENLLRLLYEWPLSAGEISDDKRQYMLAEVLEVAKGLKYRDREILKLWCSLDDEYSYSVKEIGAIFKMSEARMRRTIASAMGKLIRRFLGNRK